MAENEAKKELYSYLHSKQLENYKLEQIEEQNTKLTKITTMLSDMPKSSSAHDKMEKNVIKLLELISQHLDIMIEEETNLIKITNKIKLVEQPFRNILELRFINGFKIEEVSVKINRDYGYTKKLLKKAIKKYSEI